MNTTFVLIHFLVVAITAFAIAKGNPQKGAHVIAQLTGIFLSLFLLLITAFVGGTPIHESTTRFTVEKTPYRVIFQAFGTEQTFTDAKTVATADQIVEIRRTTERNAWGITMESSPRPFVLLTKADLEAEKAATK